MRIIFYFLLLLSITFSCKSKKEKMIDSVTKYVDSLERERQIDSMTAATMKDANFDTVGVSQAPIKVLSARMVEEEYSSYKDVSLKYKNVSTKRVDAIKFSWYGVDAFGEPADLGSFTDGFGAGFTDDPLGAGKSRSSQWSVLSSRGKKILHAWPIEVVFSDGTKWKSQSK